jgi:UDP-N-acetylmuramoylalanine--D-glutamate ligase
MNLKDKKYLVVGLGKTGISTARFLLSKGAKVVISDSRAEFEHKQELEEFKNSGVMIELGGHTDKVFLWADTIVLSPGVPYTIPQVQHALRSGIEVISEIELASKFIDKSIIAVTGSNGKTTTTTMIYNILKSSGLKVFLGGNIGTPLIDIAGSKQQFDYILIELSSFQLQGIKDFKPYIAVCLNIYPNHLDHHKDLSEYINSKTKIFSNQTTQQIAVINKDDSILRDRLEQIKAKIITFGHDAGADAHYQGFVVSYEGDDYDLSKWKLIGKHNIENAMASIIACRLVGCDTQVIKNSILEFNSLPHRIEYVREYKNARFFNDSKSTTPHSTLKALEAFDPPVILIAGGRDKGLDYSVFKEQVANKVKQLILMGEASSKIKDIYENEVALQVVSSLDSAVQQAVSSLEKGDTILFSPACSSFDMFNSYEERGRKFKEIVQCL